MAGNRVHGGQRIKFTAQSNHHAGDLVYEKGFFGVVQDDVVAGNLATLILDGVWRLKFAPSTLAMGVTVSALTTLMATSLNLVQSLATGSLKPIGRTIETGTATTAKVQLFNPNQTY